MERPRHPANSSSRIERQLAHLKILSRLMALELHTQNAPRLTFSREEVVEMKTSLDLFIEEILKAKAGASGLPPRESEVQAIPPRVN